MKGRSETFVRTIVTGAYHPDADSFGFRTSTSTRSGRLRLRKRNELWHILARWAVLRSSRSSTGALPRKKGTNLASSR